MCCGFGGTFAVKYSDISGAIVDAKAENVVDGRRPDAARGRSRLPHEHGGQAQPRGQAASQVRHVAEVLAGMTDDPPIGMSPKLKPSSKALA